MDQVPSIEMRDGDPKESIASLPGTCPSCSLSILPGDLIASSPSTLLGWRHLSCAICLKCGAWLTSESVCSNDCTAGQAEPDTGSWHDVACTIWMPPAAIRLLAPSQAGGRPQWFRIASVKEMDTPQKATTLSKVRVHLQMYTEDAPDPTYGTLATYAAKAVGICVGNVYNYFDATEVAYDIGGITIEDRQLLSRKPAWA
jgi:hypothetical protein